MTGFRLETGLGLDLDQAWGDVGLGEGDEGEGYGEFEAARACAAWVEIDDSVAGFDLRLVGVTADDHGNAGGFGVYVEVVDRVDEVEEVAREFYDFGFGQSGTGAEEIYVAPDCGDGSDGAQGGKDFGIADVAGVKDVIDTSEGSYGFWPEEAVGI